MATRHLCDPQEEGKAKTFKSGRGRGPLLALGALLLGSALLLGCQPAQPAATPKAGEKAVTTARPTKAAEKAVEKPVRGGTLRVVAATNYTSLDAHVVSDSAAPGLLFESFIYMNEKFEVTKEGLFKDWAVSPDGKTITFKLREGVKFHDGTDFDAAAVKSNIERVRDPETKSLHRRLYASVASVEVVDNSTARFNLRQPDVMLISALGSRGGVVVSPAAVKKYGQDFARNPVGTGPFQFDKWVPGDYISVKRFDGYWKKDKDGNQLPYMDGAVFKTVPDSAVAAANLRTGAADVLITVEADQWPMIKSDPNLVGTIRKITNILVVMFDTKRPPFDNKALREAVAYAVDRDGMAAVLGEKAIAHATAISPIYSWAYDPKAGVFPARDLAKAKAKMAEAGYSGGGGLKVLLSVTSALSDYINMNEILKANLAEIGIEANLQVVAQAEWVTRAQQPGKDGAPQYQIMIFLTATAVPDPGDDFLNFYHSKGGRNNMGPYSNPELDRVTDKAQSTYDQKERAALYQQAAKLVREDVPAIPMLINNGAMGVNKRVRNISYNFAWGPSNNEMFREAWLAQ